MRKLLPLMAWLFASCGPSNGGSQPAPTTPSQPADPAFAAIQPIIQRNCGDCHNGRKEPAFPDGATFKASQSKQELQSGSMPLGRAISAADKAALLGYLK